VLDILGIPDATSITQAAFDIDAGGLAQCIFYDPAATPASGELGRSGSTLYYRITDARTNTVLRALGIIADTTGGPAASIGVGMLFQAESADESPSDFGALDFVASDIGAGTEDTYASILLRVAGRALDEKYRFQSTAGDGFTAIFAHANTADRIYTLPDGDTTLLGAPTRSTADVATAETTTSVSYTDLATSGPAVTLTPGRTTDQQILHAARCSTSSAGDAVVYSVAIAGSGAVDDDAHVHTSAIASAVVRSTSHVLALNVANGATHTMKYRVGAGTGTYSNRRISAFTLS